MDSLVQYREIIQEKLKNIQKFPMRMGIYNVV